VGGDHVQVELLAGSGQSHETFAPSARQMRALAHADVYFSTELPFETALLQRIRNSMPQLRVVDTVAEVSLLALAEAHDCDNCGSHEHSHGHPHHHDSLVDVHRWLSPPILIAQTKIIAATLAQLRPDSAKLFASRGKAITAELEALDQSLQRLLEPFRNDAFMINHPALGYFAEHFGLRQIAIESEGLQPSPARIRQLSTQAREASVRWIIVQAGQPRTAAAVIAQSLGLPVVEVDPLNPDAIGEMRALAKALADAPAP
jgi:zinc transport system substrate-binding protein